MKLGSVGESWSDLKNYFERDLVVGFLFSAMDHDKWIRWMSSSSICPEGLNEPRSDVVVAFQHGFAGWYISSS